MQRRFGNASFNKRSHVFDRAEVGTVVVSQTLESRAETFKATKWERRPRDIEIAT